MDRSNTLSEPKDAKGYFERGNAFLDKGEVLKAIDDLDEAIHLNPQFARAYFNRGLAKNELGRYKESIEDFYKAIGTNPPPSPIKMQGFTIVELNIVQGESLSKTNLGKRSKTLTK